MTPEQLKDIEQRAESHRANMRQWCMSTVEEEMVKSSYVQGATDQSSISYPREDVDALIEDIKVHSFSQELVLQAINEFTSKHNTDETNT